MTLEPVRRRRLWPSKPFEQHERGTMFSVTLVVYVFLTALPGGWAWEHLPARAKELVPVAVVFWVWVCAFIPFLIVFQRTWIRLLRTPKPKRSSAEIEESPAELSAWASTVLDKHKKS